MTAVIVPSTQLFILVRTSFMLPAEYAVPVVFQPTRISTKIRPG